MPWINKKLLLPYFLYLVAFVCDAMITTHGLAHGSAEGDPIVVWLWSIFGQDSLLLKIIYVALIFGVSALFYKKVNKFLGVVIPYSLFAGHLLGFSTWVFHYNNYLNSDLIRGFYIALGIWGIFVLAPIVGLILSFLHIKIIEK